MRSNRRPGRRPDRLDRKIQLFEPGATATAIYAVIAPGPLHIDHSPGRHVPTALIDSDGGGNLGARPT
jgi:hypothetical protein